MKVFEAFADVSESGERWCVEVPELRLRDCAKHIDSVEFTAQVMVDKHFRGKDIPGERLIKGIDYEVAVTMARPYDRQGADGAPTIVCDIDGTLARMSGRGPHDYDKLGTDLLDDAVFELLDRFKGSYDIVLLTGRDEEHREVTEKWLADNGVSYSELIMRPLGNRVSDCVVKYRAFDKHLRKRLIKLVLEDRNRCVLMWRKLGIVCWQVQEGDF